MMSASQTTEKPNDGAAQSSLTVSRLGMCSTKGRVSRGSPACSSSSPPGVRVRSSHPPGSAFEAPAGQPKEGSWCACISYYSFSMTAMPNGLAQVRGDGPRRPPLRH
eukprot:7301663-Prymnesium_polylepis.1